MVKECMSCYKILSKLKKYHKFKVKALGQLGISVNQIKYMCNTCYEEKEQKYRDKIGKGIQGVKMIDSPIFDESEKQEFEQVGMHGIRIKEVRTN